MDERRRDPTPPETRRRVVGWTIALLLLTGALLVVAFTLEIDTPRASYARFASDTSIVDQAMARASAAVEEEYLRRSEESGRPVVRAASQSGGGQGGSLLGPAEKTWGIQRTAIDGGAILIDLGMRAEWRWRLIRRATRVEIVDKGAKDNELFLTVFRAELERSGISCEVTRRP